MLEDDAALGSATLGAHGSGIGLASILHADALSQYCSDGLRPSLWLSILGDFQRSQIWFIPRTRGRRWRLIYMAMMDLLIWEVGWFASSCRSKIMCVERSLFLLFWKSVFHCASNGLLMPMALNAFGLHFLSSSMSDREWQHMLGKTFFCLKWKKKHVFHWEHDERPRELMTTFFRYVLEIILGVLCTIRQCTRSLKML